MTLSTPTSAVSWCGHWPQPGTWAARPAGPILARELGPLDPGLRVLGAAAGRRHLEPRTDPVVLRLAAALKREVPGRTAAQVGAILRAHAGPNSATLSARTLQRHLAAWRSTPARTASRRAVSAGSRPTTATDTQPELRKPPPTTRPRR